jgi:hypothetical protein
VLEQSAHRVSAQCWRVGGVDGVIEGCEVAAEGSVDSGRGFVNDMHRDAMKPVQVAEAGAGQIVIL